MIKECRWPPRYNMSHSSGTPRQLILSSRLRYHDARQSELDRGGGERVSQWESSGGVLSSHMEVQAKENTVQRGSWGKKRGEIGRTQMGTTGVGWVVGWRNSEE